MSGKIGISVATEAAQNTCIAELAGGDFFGEMGLLDELPRSASSHALQDTEAYSLGKERLRGLLLAYPELGIGMLKALSRRIRKVDGDLAKSFAAVR
jgi:CRP-like cAMP-binding protein